MSSKEQILMIDLPPTFRKKIEHALIEKYQDDFNDMRDLFLYSYYSSVSNFMSDTPGFIGHIHFVVFPGGPEFTHVITESQDGVFACVQLEI